MPSRPRAPVLGILLATTLVGACGESSTDSFAGTGNPQTGSPAEEAFAASSATLEAEVLGWDGRLRVAYRFTNDAEEDVIVFDGAFAGIEDFLRVERTASGIRVFKGKASGPGVPSVVEQTIGGRLALPGQTVEGGGSVDYPLLVPAGPGSAPVTESPDTVEFCIGFDTAAAALPTMIGNGDYPLRRGAETQSLVCREIGRP